MDYRKMTKLVFVALFLIVGSSSVTTAAETPVRGGATLGLGNAYWSYGEVGVVIPIRETSNSIWNVDLRYMNHLDNSNSESNEGSVGLIYRKRLTDGPGFWGINSSYSEYRSWHGNRRQTPHLGLEYFADKFSFTANYMFQDNTVHTPSSLNKAHVYHGDYYLLQERFTGGGEAVARYFLDNRASIGIGGYFRHGEPGIGEATITYADGSEKATTTEGRYLLDQGGFIEFTYDYPLANDRSLGFGIQAKYDRQNHELLLFSLSYEFGVPAGVPWERAWNKGIYKADPDDFGFLVALAGGLLEAGIDAGVGAAVDCARGLC